MAFAVILRASMGFKPSSAFLKEPQCHCLGSLPVPQGWEGELPKLEKRTNVSVCSR